MKTRIHNKSQIDGDPTARQEGFGSAAEREDRGSGSAGQSGDLQGLSGVSDADSESVRELIEEGQFFEASVVSGVEDAADGGPVRTHERSEDDLPREYTDQRQDEPKE